MNPDKQLQQRGCAAHGLKFHEGCDACMWLNTQTAERTAEGEVPPDVIWLHPVSGDWWPSKIQATADALQYRRVETCVWIGGLQPNKKWEFVTTCGVNTEIFNTTHKFCGFCGGSLVIE